MSEKTGFVLEQRVLGPHIQIAISQVRYEELIKARRILSDAFSFEQRYELLLGNFIDLELAFTEVSLRATIEPRYQYPELAQSLRIANRQVVNVLTALKGYADQVVQDFKAMSLTPAFGEQAKRVLSATYDASPEYQFLCELRNHAQHSADAVNGFQGGTLDCDPNAWVEAVTFTTSRDKLAEDPKFKRRVLDLLPEYVDVRRYIRRGLHDIGAAHLALREIVRAGVDEARSFFESALNEYTEAGAESTLGLVARQLGKPETDVLVQLDWDDVRGNLVDKNERPPQLRPRPTHIHPRMEEVREKRERAGHSTKEAARCIGASEERWREYEDGLPMPVGLFELYKLVAEAHETHELVPRERKATGSASSS